MRKTKTFTQCAGRVPWESARERELRGKCRMNLKSRQKRQARKKNIVMIALELYLGGDGRSLVATDGVHSIKPCAGQSRSRGSETYTRTRGKAYSTTVVRWLHPNRVKIETHPRGLGRKKSELEDIMCFILCDLIAKTTASWPKQTRQKMKKKRRFWQKNQNTTTTTAQEYRTQHKTHTHEHLNPKILVFRPYYTPHVILKYVQQKWKHAKILMNNEYPCTSYTKIHTSICNSSTYKHHEWKHHIIP